MTEDIERYSYDVVVIGAGGSGLRAAIEARAHGLSTAMVEARDLSVVFGVTVDRLD